MTLPPSTFTPEYVANAIVASAHAADPYTSEPVTVFEEKSAPAETLTAEQQNAQRLIDETFNNRKSPYFDKSHPQHEAAVVEVNKLFSQRFGTEPVIDTLPPSQPQPREHHAATRADLAVDIHQVRRDAGVSLSLSTNVAEKWEAWYESDVISWAMRQGLSSNTIQKVLNFYADRVIPGYVIGPEDEQAFREAAPKMGLSAQQIETLIKSHREYYSDTPAGETRPASARPTQEPTARAAEPPVRKEKTGSEDPADAVIDQLKDEWGPAFKQRLDDARRALGDFDASGDIAKLLDDTGLGNNPEIIKMFARIGRATR